MESFSRAFIFALLAAVGNGIFVYGQKKAGISGKPFIFIIWSLLICVGLLVLAALFYPKAHYLEYIRTNYKPALLSGAGLFLTYVGFYFLYTQFGASYYILYGILSMLTTSIVVGLLIFREEYNVYYLLATLSAMLTVFLFFLGKKPK